MPSPLSGQVQTVLGSIGAEEIGVTLPHEHLLIDFEVMFVEPTAPRDKERSREPVSLANLGWVRQNFNANLDNLRLTDEQVARDEILSSRRRAAGRWWIRRRARWPAIRSPSPASPAPPAFTWSWAPGTTSPPPIPRTWTG